MNLPAIPKMKSLPEILGNFSAREFLREMAAEIQSWLDEQVLSGKVEGLQWYLLATLADGRQVTVHRMSGHGQSMVKVAGTLQDGSACLLISHQSSIQFLAVFIPQTPTEKERREMGFHTLFIGDQKIEPST
jgi:hypothetical protein